MRLSKSNKETKIIELYKSGWSYRQIQRRYRLSPNYIAKLVQGIVVICTACGKLKGKVRFHAHHPDRVNRPDYTILLCPSCHAKEEARLRREKELQSPLSAVLPTAEDRMNHPGSTSLPFMLRPLSSTEKKVIVGIGIAMLLEAFFPGFFGRRWQEIQDHWRKSWI